LNQYALVVQWNDPQQAGLNLNKQVVPWCKARMAEGHRIVAHFDIEEDAKTVQQNRFYWGVILNQISEQARIGGQRYTVDAWHELFKRQFLERTKKRVYVAGKTRPVMTTTIGTTKGLGVRKMSAFIEKVIAFGASDLGVQFSETRWEDYR